MNITAVQEIIHGNFSAITINPRHHTDNVIIRDIVFKKRVMIAGNDIAIRQNLENPVKNIPAVSPVEYNIILAASARRFCLDFDKISSLP